MRPAEGRRGQRRLASGIEESVEPAIGVGLKDAGEGLKMPRRMFAAPIARGVKQRRRRISPTKWPIVADIGPNPAGICPPLCQHRDLVTMEPLGGEHIGFDQFKDRPDGKSSGADLVRQRRDRQIDPLAFEALALSA